MRLEEHSISIDNILTWVQDKQEECRMSNLKIVRNARDNSPIRRRGPGHPRKR